VGIFLPSFLFVGISRPLVTHIRRSELAGAFLDGVNVGALALIVVVTFQLGRAALVDVPTVIIALVSAVLLVRLGLNSLWLVFGGAAIGLASFALGKA
jgi:chromate transporter